MSRLLNGWLCAVVGLWAGHALAQTVYVWTGPDGEEHYTDDRATIPDAAKSRAKALVGMGATTPQPPAPRAPAPAPTSPPPVRPPESSVAETLPPAAPPASPKANTATGGRPRVFLASVATEVSGVDLRYIEQCVAAASVSPRLAAWGGLTESVGVEIHARSVMRTSDGEDAFGRAVGLNLVWLQAPKDTRSFGFALPYEKTMLHELGHILEHQHAGQSRPRWFAEGFANYVADFPGYASPDAVAWWTIRHGGARPLEAAFSKAEVHLAYAMATEAVRFLVELITEAGLRRFFELRHSGTSFDAAFVRVVGFDVGEFQRRFIERVRPRYYDRAEAPAP
jgi:hypothetical protein